MKFHNIIIQARDYYRTLSQKKEVRTIMSGIPVRRLSQSQKKLISQYFKTNIGITTHDTLWHEMYYSINNDFDVRYIPINSKRLLNYILCIRFFIEVHSIVSASRFFHMPTYLRVVIECQSLFFPFFPAFSRNCPDYFLHTSGSSSFRSLSDLGAR